MILNVSGRTDIVAFYTDWFMKRWEEGFLDVRNPFNPKLVSRIFFEDVDLILFCTKNPMPIVDKLSRIDKPIIFQVTLTPYKKDIEPNVPSKTEVIEAIKRISSILGSENVYVRYDPIFISKKYDVAYHKKAFERLCSLLSGYVKHIIVSFIDDYKNVRKNADVLKLEDFTEDIYREIGISFSDSAKKYGMTVQTCFEERNLVEYGFVSGECLSHEMVYKMTGKAKFKTWTARRERKCNCVAMVDVGEYNTCKHFCKYCYANFDEGIVNRKVLEHDDDSSLLVGKITSDDVVKRRFR
ncbi:MAG TPA: DUF1848 domain-containing protein [Firmicutes bacterium]|nr:DUF1848 domain-containing protein [Bacillota bacterium]